MTAERNDVENLIYSLSDTQVALLGQMADAMRSPVKFEPGSTGVVTREFAEAISNFLLLHHAIHDEPLNKGNFEYLFVSCSRAAGRVAARNAAPGSAAYDVLADGTKWSLKTEKIASETSIKIEKLMDARWIRECTNPHKCAVAVAERIPAHLADYDRIMVLRNSLDDATGTATYQLMEIPTTDLMRLSSATDELFKKEGKKESYGADVDDDNGDRLFRILLDSSVEKVRIAFRVQRAVHHGTWTLNRNDASVG